MPTPHIPGSTVRYFNSKIPLDLIKRLKVEAIMADIPTDQLMTRIVQEYFDRRTSPVPPTPKTTGTRFGRKVAR